MAESDNCGSDEIYENNHRRPTVRRQITETLPNELHSLPYIKPLDTKEYREKIDTLNNVRTGKSKKNRHTDLDKSSFLNRAITYFGETKAKLDSNPGEIAKIVETFVQLLLVTVASEDERFQGELRECGSYYEGAKVKHPNEFDYIWELKPSSLTADDLIFKHEKPHTLKPRKRENIYGRTYFQLDFKDVPSRWKCGNCRRNERICSHRKQLKPRETQQLFKNLVQKVASAGSKEAHVTLNGPAVTLCTKVTQDASSPLMTDEVRKALKRYKDINYFLIKIDITLAIPVKKSDPRAKWPFQDESGIVFNEGAGSECHLVTAGDFWKLSFTTQETSMMRELIRDDHHKKYCFQALKCLRDELALTGDHETALLSTYPLKVTFLKENDNPGRWNSYTISDRTESILMMLEKGGAEGTLTNYFVKDDPVMLESDRSYLESRRILQHLNKMAHLYRVNGYIHMVILIIFILCHMSIMITSALFVGTECPGYDGFALGLPDYVFIILPLTFVGFSLSLVGVVLVVTQLFCLRSKSVLYKMFKGPLYAYITFAVIGFFQAIVDIWLAVEFQRGDCQKQSPGVIMRGTVVLGLSCVIVISILIHVGVFMAYARRKIKYFSWEIVFCDVMYHEILRCQSAHDTTPKVPPRRSPPSGAMANTNSERQNEQMPNVLGQGRDVHHTSPDALVRNPRPPETPALLDEIIYEDTTDILNPDSNHSRQMHDNGPSPEAPPVPPGGNKNPSLDNPIYSIS